MIHNIYIYIYIYIVYFKLYYYSEYSLKYKKSKYFNYKNMKPCKLLNLFTPPLTL